MDEEALTSVLISGLNNFFLDNYPDTKSTIVNGNIVFPDWEITTKITIIDKQSNNSIYLITERYEISSPKWDREFIDVCCDFGKDDNELLVQAMNSAVGLIFGPILMYLKNDKSSTEKTIYGSKEHLWNVYQGNAMMSNNKPPNVPNVEFFWDCIKESVLKENLGNQKINFIKIFINKNDEKLIIECSMNNEVIAKLNDIIRKYAEEWDIPFFKFKQYIVISQDEKTYIPYPYTKNQVMNMVQKALIAFENNNYQNDDNYYDELEKITNDSNLAWEMSTFIPEICTLISLKELDNNPMVIFSRNNKDITCNFHQITSCNFLKAGILQTLNNDVLKHEKEVITNMVSFSAMAKAVSASLNSDPNTSFKDLAMCIAFMPPNNYIFN